MNDEQPSIEPVIRMGTLEGRSRLYNSTYHLDELKALAKNLVNGRYGRPGIKAENFYLYYDKGTDFHRLEFDLNGAHYNIRFYKVYAVTKNGIDDFDYCKLFNHHRSVVEDFFLGANKGERGTPDEWIVPASKEEAQRLSHERFVKLTTK